MLKKKYGLINKLKVCGFWLFRHGEAITVVCGKCGSSKLEFIEGQQTDNVYRSTYKCRKCGSIAKNTEIWK